MIHVDLIRLETKMNATLGVVLIDNSLICYSFELPWKANIRNHSCIPCGHYDLERRDTWHKADKLGYTYEIIHVPDREGILFHPGNTVEDIEGCIIPGTYPGWLRNSRAVLESTAAFIKFKNLMRKERWARIHISQLITGD